MVHLPRPPILGSKADWFYHSPCVCNHLNALVHRVGTCVPYPNEDCISRLRSLSAELAKLVGRHSQIPLQAVVDGFSGARRRRYERAKRNYQRWGIKKSDSDVKMFVKLEGIKFSEGKVNPACRAIQWRNPVFTLVWSSYLKQAEHALYDCVGGGSFPPGPLFAKNMNPAQRAQAIVDKAGKLPGCKMYMLDVSRFDAHMTSSFLEVENEFWAFVIQGGEELADILRWKKGIRGSFRVGDKKFKYRNRDGRCSGDADTAASNCVQMCLQLTAFGHFLRQRDSTSKFDFIVDGDDSVFFYKGLDFTEDFVKEYFVRCGLTMKVDDVVEDVREVNFCQGKPCRIDGKWLNVRDPFKILSKTTINPKFSDIKLRPKLLKTIAVGELSIYAGTPVIDTYLRALIRSADNQMSKRGLKDSGMLKGDWWMSYRMKRDMPRGRFDYNRAVPITPLARSDFAVAWGISVDIQKQWEEVLSLWECVITDIPKPGESVNSRTWEYDWRRREDLK